MNDRDNNMKRRKTNSSNTNNSNTSNSNTSNNNTSSNNTSNNSTNNRRNNSNYSNSYNNSNKKKTNSKNNFNKIQNRNTRNKTGHKIKNNFKLLMKDMSIDTDKLRESNIDTNKTNSYNDSKINNTSDNNTISNNTSNKDYKPRYNFKKICKEINIIADEIRKSSEGLTVIELNSPDEFPEKFWNTFIKTTPYSEIRHDRRLLPIINNIKSYLPIISTMPAYFQYVNLFDDISFTVITINNSIYFGWKNIPIESVYNDIIFIDAMKTRITFELGRYLRSCKIRKHRNKSTQIKNKYAEIDSNNQTISQINNEELKNPNSNSNSNNNSSNNNSSNDSNRNNSFKSKYNSIASSQINIEQLIPSNMVIIDIPRVLDKMSDPAENRLAAKEVNLDIRKVKYYNSLLYNCYSMTLVNDSLTCINANESDAKKVISTYKKIDELVMFANCIYKLKLSDLKFNSSSDEIDFIIHNFDYLCKVKKNECKNIKKIV